MQAKHKARLHGPSADTSWLRAQVKKELTAWADPEGRRASAGKRPDYLIVTTNVPLSGVTGSGGKDRMDALIRQYAPQVGLKGWQVWDGAKITTLLDANPQIRQAFAALITSNEVLARLMARMDKLGEQPLVSLVLGTAAARPGEPRAREPRSRMPTRRVAAASDSAPPWARSPRTGRAGCSTSPAVRAMSPRSSARCRASPPSPPPGRPGTHFRQPVPARLGPVLSPSACPAQPLTRASRPVDQTPMPSGWRAVAGAADG
jgi:hypothetical protein